MLTRQTPSDPIPPADDADESRFARRDDQAMNHELAPSPVNYLAQWQSAAFVDAPAWGYRSPWNH